MGVRDETTSTRSASPSRNAGPIGRNAGPPTVPCSSEVSSGMVPMKSKDKQLHERFKTSPCGSGARQCWEFAQKHGPSPFLRAYLVQCGTPVICWFLNPRNTTVILAFNLSWAGVFSTTVLGQPFKACRPSTASLSHREWNLTRNSHGSPPPACLDRRRSSFLSGTLMAPVLNCCSLTPVVKKWVMSLRKLRATRGIRIHSLYENHETRFIWTENPFNIQFAATLPWYAQRGTISQLLTSGWRW